MIAMKIFYPNREDVWFDLDYYINHHMRMAKELAGTLCRGITIEAAIDNKDLPYIAIGTELYESVEDYHTALDAHRELLRNDIANFTNITPIVQFLDIKEI